MKLGITTYMYMWSIGLEGAQPVKPLTAMGLLEKAHEFGVRVLQMGPNLPLDQLPPAELDAFCQTAHRWGIALEMATRGLETGHLKQQIELCKRVGAPLLRTIAEVGGKTAPVKQLPDYLRAILPVLEKENMMLGIENTTLAARDLRWALEEVGSARLGIVLDTVNSLAVPEGWREVTEILAPYTMCLHIKDFVVERVWNKMGFTCEGRAAGQGMLDIPWMLEACKRSQYDYNVIIELWVPQQSTLQQSIDLEQEWARQSVAFMRRYIQD